MGSGRIPLETFEVVKRDGFIVEDRTSSGDLTAAILGEGVHNAWGLGDFFDP